MTEAKTAGQNVGKQLASPEIEANQTEHVLGYRPELCFAVEA